MCLRFQFCTHHRVCILHFLKKSHIRCTLLYCTWHTHNKLMIRWINGWYIILEWSYELDLFTTIMHRINNTGWMMKWWWREGWNEVQTPILRECWTFLIYIFLHQKRKQCLEFALPKPVEICKHLAGAYNSNSHTRRL